MSLFTLSSDDIRKWLAREGGMTPSEAKTYVNSFHDDVHALCVDLREEGDELLSTVGGDMDRAADISDTFCRVWLDFCELVGDGAEEEDTEDEETGSDSGSGSNDEEWEEADDVSGDEAEASEK